jgi:uncharacterized protein
VTAPPLLVGVADIRRHPGSRLEVDRHVPGRDLGPLTLLDTRVPEDGDITVDLVLESIPDGIVATGVIEAPYEATCRRCLESVEGSVRQDVREIFATSPVEGETYPLGQDEVDLEPLVREQVLLSLPAAPLCSEDCKGPVPEAFEEGDPEPEPDPRWAALDDLDL